MMFRVKSSVLKLYLNIFMIFGVLLLIYFMFSMYRDTHNYSYKRHDKHINITILEPHRDYNVWLIFTKVNEDSPLRHKFHKLLRNILNISSVPLQFHIIVDNSSRSVATYEISNAVSDSKKPIYYKFYSVEECAAKISDLVDLLMPHFSSKPGSYYSDVLFYISLGLGRIAPASHRRAVLLDCDLFFKEDIKLLFEQFTRFKPGVLFGLAQELTPVYRHILQKYRSKHNETSFGDYFDPTRNSAITKRKSPHPQGYQGYNSGVVLINLSAIRSSREFPLILRNETIRNITNKYEFRGHLGDQDFYTLMGFEYPHLVHTLSCGFNRQLCTWWRDRGYKDVFPKYHKCTDKIVILHGNCNTHIPK